MASTIQLKTGTGSAEPTSLSQGEVGINIDNGLFYYGSGSGNNVKQLETFTHITASGNISASGDIYAEQFYARGGNGYKLNNGKCLWVDSGDLQVGNTGLATDIIGTSINLQSPITASGNISSSGIIQANEFKLSSIFTVDGTSISHTNSSTLGNNALLDIHTITGKTSFIGNVTASGNISSSGHISASDGGAGFVVRPNLYYYANCDAITYTEALDGDFPSTNTATASFAEEINSNSAVFTLADDTLTIARAGIYKFTYNLTTEVKVASNRTEGAGAIVRTPSGGVPALIDGSVVHTYNRFVTASPGISRTTGTATVLINVAVDDAFKILFVRYDATSSSTKLQTVPRATSWIVEAVT